MRSTVPLTIPYQINTGNALAVSLAAPRPIPLLLSTQARGEAVVAATYALNTFAGHTPTQVDRATDAVIVGFDRILDDGERCLRDSVVPLGEAQQEALARTGLLRARLLPKGTEFIRQPMILQWSDLVALRAQMQEPDVADAIDGLGLRPHADHLLAHIERYGQVLGSQGSGPRAGAEEACAAWNEAFRVFAAQVTVDYQNDAVMQKELLGVYESQLEQQRAAARAARSRPAHPATGETAPAPAPAPTPAPTPAPAPDTAAPNVG